MTDEQQDKQLADLVRGLSNRQSRMGCTRSNSGRLPVG